MALSKSPYRGTRDFFPADMRKRNYIFAKWAEVSELFAYEPYDGPLLEEVDLYRAKSGEELINEQVYNFVDRGEREVAIRPEMTPTLARMVAQVHREVPKPLRMYAVPNLMRYEKPQRGRLREFWQYNADIFGAGEQGEAEVIQLAIALLRAFGANQEHFEILINDRRFVDFVFQSLIKLDQEGTKKLYKLVDHKNKMEADKFTAEVKKITNDDQKTKVFEDFVGIKSTHDIALFVQKYDSTDIHSEKAKPLINLFEQLNNLGLGEYVKFDPSIVRGLDYYTGIVFEIFDKHPENRRAIAGGGAYANLLQIFNEPALPGIGFGMGEVPLTDFLNTHKLMPDFSKAQVDVLLGYLVPEGEKSVFQLADHLRHQGIKVETIFGETKPKKAFSLSEKKNFQFIGFVGEEEVKNQQVQLKNLNTKETANLSLNDINTILKTIKGPR